LTLTETLEGKREGWKAKNDPRQMLLIGQRSASTT